MPELHYSEIVGKFDGQIYQSSGCEPYASDPALGWSFYEIGAPVPFSSFAALTRTEEGHGRMKLATVRTEAGELVATQRFYDSTLSSLCYPAPAADSKTRCLPETRHGVYFYLDNACTQGLVFLSPEEEVPPPGTFVTFVSSDADNDTRSIFGFGKKIAPPGTVYQRNVGCEPTPVLLDLDWYDTEALPPTNFVEVTLESG